MAGQHHDACVLQMRFDQAREPGVGSGVQRIEGLIKDPQGRGLAQCQTCQSAAPPLALRQAPDRGALKAAQASAFERGQCSGDIGFVPTQCAGIEQIFKRRQLVFQRRCVAQVDQAVAKHITLAGQGLTAPQHLALCGLQQAAQHAQQAGFACAVGTTHAKQLACHHMLRNTRKKLAATPCAAQLAQGEYARHFKSVGWNGQSGRKQLS